jgi:hypothetical protein
MEENCLAQFKVLPRNQPGGTEENHENIESGRPVSGGNLNSGSTEHPAGVLHPQLKQNLG